MIYLLLVWWWCCWYGSGAVGILVLTVVSVTRWCVAVGGTWFVIRFGNKHVEAKIGVFNISYDWMAYCRPTSCLYQQTILGDNWCNLATTLRL